MASSVWARFEDWKEVVARSATVLFESTSEPLVAAFVDFLTKVDDDLRRRGRESLKEMMVGSGGVLSSKDAQEFVVWLVMNFLAALRLDKQRLAVLAKEIVKRLLASSEVDRG